MENIYKSKLVKDGKIDVLIISHQDADGIGSAALALVDIEARGGFGTIITDMNPSTTTTDEMIKSVEDIDNYELIFILDRAPLSEELMKTLRKDITVIYIDHHETNFDIARKMTDEFEGFTGILNKNDSAALITADFFGFDNKIINLIDEWDTFKWTNKQDELKCSVHEILNFNFIAKSIDSTLLFSEIKKVLDGTSSVSKLMITYRQAIKVARFEIFDCSESLNRSDNITELPNSKKLLVLNFTPPFSVGGIALALIKYGKGLKRDEEKENSTIYKLLSNQYYIPVLYDKIIAKPYAALSLFAWKKIDLKIVDATVDRIAGTTMTAGDKTRTMQNGNLSDYLRWMAAGVVILVAVAFAIHKYGQGGN